MPGGDVALFIDWDNLKIELNKRGQSPTISRLWELAGEHGRLVVAKAYADWPWRHDLRRDQYDLYVEGIEPVFVPCRAPDGRFVKNSVDVKMSADCLDVSYLNPNVKVFVLVSGDVDFLHVADSLRRRGLIVVIIGVRGSTSNRLGESVDTRVFYDDAPALPAAETKDALKGVGTKPVFDALHRVLEEQRMLKNYPVPFANLKPLLKTVLPDFEEAAYGARKFKEVARAAERAGILRIVTQNLIDRAVLPEDDPAREANRIADAEADLSVVVPKAELCGAMPLEKESINTSDAILTELICTYVEVALSNLFPNVTRGRVQQYALIRARKSGDDLPSGFSHADALKGISNASMGKHVANAVALGAFKQVLVPNSTEEGTITVLHLDDSHPMVKYVLNHPAPV